MKKLILGIALALSASAFADSPIFPQIFNFGNSVQVQIYNPNEKDHHCSGMVHMNTIPFGTESQYYYDIVRARSTSFRTFFLFRPGARITNAFHSIYCREI